MKPLIDPYSKSLASGLAVFSAMALTAFGQKLPEPLVYFALDEAEGATVAVDSTGNGHDGTVVNSVTFGEGGAPGGASSSGAARFTDGILNVPTFDVPALLGNRDGAGGVDTASYTMAAWIKPDAASLAGDRFFFGQGDQGIHNGLRDNGRLHQAHWGNDHYGNTILNETDWVHATFVYDGAADLGTVYLNGTADSDPTGKASPNGTGNLIIGGRGGDQNNGGGEKWYNGLIDDIAVWDSILTDTQIQALADGVNPFSLDTGEDDDGDGMDDGWEAA
ncbi:MAG: LamG domain-containing protein, partial [Akkermansiaceae bacterium]|nr:LamG domain-containing protein [Akkermansiaceae bacterium]